MKYILVILSFALIASWTFFITQGHKIIESQKPQENQSINQNINAQGNTKVQGNQLANSGTSIDVVSDINLEKIFTEEEILFSDYYEIIQNSGINIYDTIYSEFKNNVFTVEEFEEYVQEFGMDTIFVGVVKNQEKDLWLRLMTLIYDSNMQQENNEEFKERLMTYYVDPGEDPKKSFINTMSSSYDSFPVSDEGLINPDMSDSLAIFNTFSLDTSLGICSTINYINHSESSINSCEDRIFFYRANMENGYCERIQDKYDKAICKDSLKTNKF